MEIKMCYKLLALFLNFDDLLQKARSIFSSVCKYPSSRIPANLVHVRSAVTCALCCVLVCIKLNLHLTNY